VNDDILAKARKLLAKGEDPAATPAEAETYTKKAMALIAEYGIDEALLAEKHADKRKVGELEVECHAPFSQEKAILINTISVALGCRGVLRTKWRDGDYRRASQSDRQVKTMHLFGRESDLRRVELLYTSLLLQQANALTSLQIPHFENSPAAYRRSWLQGYTAAIGSRLEAAEKAAAREADERPERAAETASGNSTALVLARRDEEVEEAMRGVYPHLKQSKSRQSSGNGFGSGYAEGRRADLGGNHVGAGVKGAIGG